jgi:hypothetical protein
MSGRFTLRQNSREFFNNSYQCFGVLLFCSSFSELMPRVMRHGGPPYNRYQATLELDLGLCIIEHPENYRPRYCQLNREVRFSNLLQENALLSSGRFFHF